MSEPPPDGIFSIEVRAGQVRGEPNDNATRSWVVAPSQAPVIFEVECDRARGEALIYALRLQERPLYKWVEMTSEWSDPEA